MNWAAEVDHVHMARLQHILHMIGVESCSHSAGKLATDECEAGIIYSKENFVLLSSFPIECLKYISRLFYVPFTCHELDTLIYHKEFQNLLMQQHQNSHESIVLRICSSPKNIELQIGQHIIPSINQHLHSTYIDLSSEFDDKDSNFSYENDWIQLHPTSYTHSLYCIYHPLEGYFKWGIVDRSQSINQKMTFELIETHLNDSRLSAYQSRLPVSRAYYKLEEILHLYLPYWKWTHFLNPLTSVSLDLGASPGGWSQCLSSVSREVIAIDAGLLHDSIHTQYNNIIHVPYSIQASEVQSILRSYLPCTHNDDVRVNFTSNDKDNHRSTCIYPINILVCDINCDALIASTLLSQYILPYIQGYGQPFHTSNNCTNMNEVSEDTLSLHQEVLIVLTLKLQRNPKPRHIIHAVNTVLKIFQEAVNCYPSEHSQSNKTPLLYSYGDWQWEKSQQEAYTCTLTDVCHCIGKDAYVIHLSANSSNERTLILRRRSCNSSGGGG